MFGHKDAFYFLPTEDEWVKAAYWNGSALQTYATRSGESLAQGDGTTGHGWNYWSLDNGYATNPEGPWKVGSGSRELNGTYDMMGNDWEWMESPWNLGVYSAGSLRASRGGYWYGSSVDLDSATRVNYDPTSEYYGVSFRVASIVPEPGSLAMLLGLALTVLLCRCRRRA
jgi:formylglycine-generating enzyme required for sulfatase activity